MAMQKFDFPRLDIGTSRLTLLVVCVSMLVGCGEAGPAYRHAELAGSVTLDGTPVESGRVNFMPAAGTSGQPVSAEIQAGRFVAEQVPLGDVTATFVITQNTGEMITEGDREPYPEIVSVVPKQYVAGIPINVTGDNAAQDFALVNK